MLTEEMLLLHDSIVQKDYSLSEYKLNVAKAESKLLSTKREIPFINKCYVSVSNPTLKVSIEAAKAKFLKKKPTPYFSDILLLLKKRGVLSDSDIVAMNSLKELISCKEAEYHDLFSPSKRHQYVHLQEEKLSELITLKNEYSKIYEIYFEYYSCSKEYIVDDAFIFYCLHHYIVNEDGKQMYSSIDEMSNILSQTLMNKILYFVVEYLTSIPDDLIRWLARRPDWRLRWVAYKNGGHKILPGEPYEWDVDKQRFFSYLCFYNNVMDLPEEERPPDYIFNDDVEMEKWWEQKNNKAIARMKTGTSKTHGGNVETFSF